MRCQNRSRGWWALAATFVLFVAVEQAPAFAYDATLIFTYAESSTMASRTTSVATNQFEDDSCITAVSGESTLTDRRPCTSADNAVAARAGTRMVHGGIATAEKALGNAEKWLGKGYKEVASGVFRSADGRRQFRMTDSDLLDLKQGPHVHFESIAEDGRTIIENSHVLLEP